MTDREQAGEAARARDGQRPWCTLSRASDTVSGLCDGEGCAWWDRRGAACSVATLGERLTDAAERLGRVLEGLRRGQEGTVLRVCRF